MIKSTWNQELKDERSSLTNPRNDWEKFKGERFPNGSVSSLLQTEENLLCLPYCNFLFKGHPLGKDFNPYSETLLNIIVSDKSANVSSRVGYLARKLLSCLLSTKGF